MLKKLILFVLLTNIAFAQKLTLDQRRTNILSIVNEELSEVSRLAKQQNFRSPDTILRISELNLERARLWREVENEKYLTIPPEERRNLNKNSFFKRSSKYFSEANKSANFVVKRFPSYRGLGEVYFILAYNYKELGNHKLAQKYFKLASDKSTPNSKVAHKSKLALADYYFNDNNFKKAIPLYEASVNKVDEKWWTKDAFNLAWSYYRASNYSRAIDLMKEVHRKSGDEKYINMRSMVERDIAIFFVDAGRMQDAVKFYESLGIDYTQQFVKVATAITTQGRFDQAESLLNKASQIEKNRDRRIEILMAELDLFDKFNKVGKHLKASRELLKLHQAQPINEDQLKRFSYHVNKKAAELQKSTASDTYKNVPKVKNLKSKQAIAYFEISSILNPSEKAEKTFFQGETAYAAGHYAKALRLYVQAFDVARAQQNTKLITQSLEGMLSSLGQKSLKKKSAEKYYSPVYTRYLTVDSRSERAKSIFGKLFNTQYDANDISSAEKTLAAFAHNFPSDFKIQEAMLAKIMEHYRKKKDYDQVKNYVLRINNGEFKVSKKYADALRSLMTKIQIEGVQQSLEKGQKAVALQGYHQIYESLESTPKARTNAAYNLSALYYELGDNNKSYLWSTTALKDMSTSDVVKFADSFLSMSAGLFLRQHFAQSADLSYRMVAKLCKENSSNKAVAYKNAVFISLANGELDKALEIRDFGKNCLIPEVIITEVSLEILKDLAASKRWESYESIISEVSQNSRNYPLLIKPYEELRLVYISLGDTDRARSVEKKQNDYFNQARSQKLDIPVEALDMMAERMLVKVIEKRNELDQIALQFPEDVFNNAVKSKIQLLQQLNSQVTEIQNLGSGKGIVEAYKYLIESYESFGKSLQAFTPEGKAPEYVESFKKAMSEVYLPILADARKQRAAVKTLILENKILSQSNYVVLYPGADGVKRFVSDKNAVLMDRGGKR